MIESRDRLHPLSALRREPGWLPRILIATLLIACVPSVAHAQGMADKVRAITPELETYIESSMKLFDNPGLAIGIVTGDKLVYAKGFGVRQKGGQPVDTKTVFQIGSTTKAFLATTMAIGVDQKKFAWDDKVVDLHPDFQMADPWVTREFRLFELLTQRSGLPREVNDIVGLLGATQTEMIRSLRAVEPVSSFRMSFSYTNITHMLAGQIVADRFGKSDWDSVVRETIFEPLGMKNTSLTAKDIEANANHAEGHRWASTGTVEVPFTQIFPYDFAGAGAINSNIEDLSTWVRLHLAGGVVDGKRIVTEEALAFTKTPRVPVSDKLVYAMGWVVQLTPNGQIVWHNGGTPAFGAFIGTVRDKDVGVIVLTNEANVGLPDALGEWVLHKLLGNTVDDLVALKLKAAKEGEAASTAIFAKSAAAVETPPLKPLAGTFSNGSFGDATLTENAGALALKLERTGAVLDFKPRGGYLFDIILRPEDRFAAVAANLGPTPIGFAEFQVDPAGHYNRLDVLFPDNGQSYIFTRNE
ncbi:serine hydrolase domain-containing protein [Taklimakanibacter deserti]|uniref:serine hydrolase domain-containing protein n=1 Tax=Taklimakanibacter deserti TaxID=2267839 RepID=UPI000E650612